MLGYALYRLGQYSAAIEVFDMALDDAGDNAERRGQILGDRSLSLAALGHYDEAIAEAGRALELAPTSATLNHTLGFVLYFSGRPSDAIPPDREGAPARPGLRRRPTARWRWPGRRRARPIRPSRSSRRSWNATHSIRTAILQLSNLHVQAGRFEEAIQVLDPT